MFGKYLEVTDNYVIVENNFKKVESSVLGVHVVFEQGEKKIVGEVVNVTTTFIKINFIGEILNNNFCYGVNLKPTEAYNIRVIYKNEVQYLLGNSEQDSSSSVIVGESLIYPSYKVSASINKLFSNHFAILGNTGSGKSCMCASLIQSLFYRNNNIPVNSNIVLFDVYGEYQESLKKINESSKTKVHFLTTKSQFSEGDIIKIPLNLLEVDDLALLLEVDDAMQIPIIKKALDLVYIFASEENTVIENKNYILAKALLDILSSGRTSTQIRDQLIAVLTEFNTIDISLSSSISQPGYVRTLKQCLNIDATGKINTIQLVVEFLEKYVAKKPEKKEKSELEMTLNYTLKDLYLAFEFALISEGILKSDKVYDKNNILKVRLDHIINSEKAEYFNTENFISKENFVRTLFISPTGEKSQILLINLGFIDERFAKVLTKIYSRIFYDYTVSLQNRGSFPINIILEEAHRYVQNDRDTDIIGYNIFDRITKEGRKYGTLLGLISQRPSELSTTVISQCHNFITFRMFYPKDIDIISSVSYNLTDYSINKLKALSPGTALCFGTAFNTPTFIKVNYPDPPTNSSNVDINKIWFN